MLELAKDTFEAEVLKAEAPYSWISMAMAACPAPL